MEIHREIPCVAILNKQKCHLFFLSFFFKIRKQEGGTGPAWVFDNSEGERGREKV
jgi:hypothetical protein